MLFDILFSLGGNIEQLMTEKTLDSKFKTWVSKQFKGNHS